FRFPEAPRLVRIRGTRERNHLWQKERLLNILLDYVPGYVDAVCWIDADIEFLNPHWPEETRRALTNNQVAQLFEECYQVDPGGQLECVGQSTAAYYAAAGARPGRLKHTGESHCGFAWVARAHWLRHVRFEDTVITSTGDSIMARAFTG